MLQVTIPESENWDIVNECFIYTKKTVLQLEHSLVSISKWEAKYKKPFINNENMNREELQYYVKCMTLTQNVDPSVYDYIPDSTLKEIIAYIGDSMTATTFSNEGKGPPSREIITSELIYYSMVAYQIPMECQKWHLNRLMTLIHICSIKNDPKKAGKKMPRKEQMSQQAALNAARRKRLGSSG